eukprot:COSAG02_NODE_58467_length_277_cov_0.691011_1_plen_38_part_10
MQPRQRSDSHGATASRKEEAGRGDACQWGSFPLLAGAG